MPDITSLLRRFLKHPVVGGSAVLFAGALVAGALNYIFNVIMAREAWLGPVDYGSLAALTSVLYLVGLIGTTFSTVTAKYTASFIAADEKSSVGRLIKAVHKRIYWYGVPTLILMAGSSRLIAHWLHLEQLAPVLWLIPLVLLTLLLSVMAGALQGVLAFTSLALVSMGGALLRLLLAAGAVLLGWGVSGVLAASVGAQGIVYGLAYVPLRHYFNHSSATSRLPRQAILNYTGPVFIALVGLTSFLSTDVILAKHFLSASAAGQYSGLSLLARIIYFASLPLIQVMFPIASQHAVQKKSTHGTVVLTLGALVFVAGSISILYFVWPTTVVRSTIGYRYSADDHLLGLLALTLSFVSIASWLTQYLLAHHKPRAAWIPLAAAGLQVLLIFRYHRTLADIVWSSLSASSILVVSLLLYTLWWRLRSAEGVDK